MEQLNSIPLYKNEAEFERAFADECERQGMHYIKIPDVIPQKNRKTGTYFIPSAKKRAFDGYLALPLGNIAIELKYGNGQLKPHQKTELKKIYQINGLAVVGRYKWTKTKGSQFIWEDIMGDEDEKIVFDNIEEFVRKLYLGMTEFIVHRALFIIDYFDTRLKYVDNINIKERSDGNN